MRSPRPSRTADAWLRREFDRIEAHVHDARRKPPRHALEYVLARAWPERSTRTPSEVYWEHILLRYPGDMPLDIERNYSPDLKLSLIGTGAERLLAEGHGGSTLRGLHGIEVSARILNQLLPTTHYTIFDTIVRGGGHSGWVTEQWGYFDPQTQIRVRGGIDTFRIGHGKIRAKIFTTRSKRPAPMPVSGPRSPAPPLALPPAPSTVRMVRMIRGAPPKTSPRPAGAPDAERRPARAQATRS